MQTIIVAGFIVLLAFLLFFLYREKEEDTEQMIVERTVTEAETALVKGEEKEAVELTEAEAFEPERAKSKEIEQRRQVEDLEGIGETYQRLLNSTGITSIASLASQDPEELLEKMIETNDREQITKRPPSLENVEDWVQKAKTKAT